MTEQHIKLHERLDVLMGPKMVAFLDKFRAACASGKPKEIFSIFKGNPAESKVAQLTVEEQMDALHKANGTVPEIADAIHPTSMDVAVAQGAAVDTTGVSAEKTAAKLKKTFQNFLSKLRQNASSGQPILATRALSSQAV